MDCLVYQELNLDDHHQEEGWPPRRLLSTGITSRAVPMAQPSVEVSRSLALFRNIHEQQRCCVPTAELSDDCR
ncbi:hypothetical protein PIB30_067401, partial [Stylosanthes scabra]|nr:hypothetical protein [Stylosanthes scabra]